MVTLLGLVWAGPALAAEPAALVPRPRVVECSATRRPVPARLEVAVGDGAARAAAAYFARRMEDIGIATKRTTREEPDVIFVRVPEVVVGPYGAQLRATSGSYSIDIQATRVRVASANSDGFFAASRTLVQLFRGGTTPERCAIVDWPTFALRGVMIDIARGAVPTVGTLKRLIDRSAAMKLNALMLYSEASFAVGPLEKASHSSVLTKAEIAELVGYARDQGVSLIPHQQSFAHTRRLVEAAPAFEVATIGRGTLNIGSGDVRVLIRRLQRDVWDVFRSPIQHIGGDEVDVSLFGPSGAELYARTVNEVEEDLSQTGSRTMIWADVALRQPLVLQRLSKRVLLATWNYDVRVSYAGQFEPLRTHGFDVVAVAGSQTWLRLVVDLRRAEGNIVGMARAAQEAGALGLFTAVWNDDGQSLFGGAEYSVAMGAATAWEGPDVDLKGFRERFDAVRFGLASSEVLISVERLSATGSLLASVGLPLSWRALWAADPVAAIPLSLQQKGALEEVQQVAAKAESNIGLALSQVQGGDASLEVLRFTAAIVKFRATLSLVGSDVTRFVKNGRGSRSALVRALCDLEREAGQLAGEYQRLWTSGSKPGGLQVVAGRFFALRSRIQAACASVQGW